MSWLLRSSARLFVRHVISTCANYADTQFERISSMNLMMSLVFPCLSKSLGVESDDQGQCLSCISIKLCGFFTSFGRSGAPTCGVSRNGFPLHEVVKLKTWRKYVSRREEDDVVDEEEDSRPRRERHTLFCLYRFIFLSNVSDGQRAPEFAPGILNALRPHLRTAMRALPESPFGDSCKCTTSTRAGDGYRRRSTPRIYHTMISTPFRTPAFVYPHVSPYTCSTTTQSRLAFPYEAVVL